MKKIIINQCYGGWSLSNEAIEEYKKRSGTTKMIHSYCEELRDDPILVEVVDAMIKEGKRAGGSCASLSVVGIPDEYDYWIDEYDGIEGIHLQVNEEYLRKLIRQGNEDDIVKYVMDAG